MGSFYDAVILGGGLMGCAMGVSLASRGNLVSRILILERNSLRGEKESKGGNPSPPPPPPFSNRVLSLNPSSQELLRSLGVWKKDERNSSPVSRIVAWDSGSGISFDGDLSVIAENSKILESFRKRMKDLDEIISFQTGIEVSECRLGNANDSTSSLVLSDGREIQTSLVIGADGMKSMIRESAGFSSISKDYAQMGLVATLEFEEPTPHPETAYQRFLPGGPIALLPLDSQHSSLVWTLPSPMAKEYSSVSEEDFLKKLNDSITLPDKSLLCSSVIDEKEISYLRFKRAYSRAIFPLGLAHSVNYVNPGVALIGDAAHRVHPLAGLGANMGFSDVRILSNKLEENSRDGQPFGSFEYLKEYESQSQLYNVQAMMAIHFLQKLYCNDNPLLARVRGFGLNVVNGINPLKNFFISRAANA